MSQTPTCERLRFSHITGIFNYAHSVLLISGFLCGSSLLVGLHQFQASFGTTLVATTGLILALLISLVIGQSLPRRVTEDIAAPRKLASGDIIGWFAMSHLGLAAATLAVPWAIPLMWPFVGRLSLETVSHVGSEMVVYFVAAMLVLSFQTIVMIRLPWHWICEVAVDRGDPRRRSGNGVTVPGTNTVSTDSRSQAHFSVSASTTDCENTRRKMSQTPTCERLPAERLAGAFAKYLLGVSLGILVGATCLAPYWNVRTLGLLTALLECAVFVVELGRCYRANSRGLSLEAADSLPITGTFDSKSVRIFSLNFRVIPAFLSVGVLLAALSRLLHQLMPVGSSTIATEWAIALCGVGLGILFAERLLRRETSPERLPLSLVASLGISLWAVVLIAAFPLLTNLFLWLNANVAQVAGVVASRVAIMSLILFPIAFVWEMLVRGHWATRNISVAIGFLIARWFLFERFGVAVSLIGAAWTLILVSLANAWPILRRRQEMNRVTCWATAVLVTLVLVSPCWMSRYAPIRSARLLFDTNVFWAKRNGLSFALLPYVDAERCVGVREGERSTFSVWRCGGTRLQIRESGVPKSSISPEPGLCPHYAPEVLQVVVPLSLHETPFRVLLLGLGAGTQLETCLAFPTQSIVCVEADRQLVSLLKSTVTGSRLANALNDERLHLVIAEPALAVAWGASDFDVVLGNPDLPALLQSASRMTEEYYRHVAQRLAPQGIFCQRFQNADCGAETLRILAKTLQAVFHEVVALETAPGEILFLATNAPNRFNRPGFLERLKTPHVRSLLGNLGIDWSELLNLSLVSHSALTQITLAERTDTNTVANGCLTFQLPREVMRWGAKRQEIVALLSPHSTRLVSLVDKDAQGPELQQRQRTIVSRNDLMTNYPDRYWVYRKTVKKQLTRHPRSKIRLLSGEMPRRDLRIEDQRRLDYFEALDQAAKDPTSETIQAVAAFRTPYDPLISHFLDQEVAALWTRCPQRDVRRELVHRLRAIYGSSPADRSIRDVIAALALLREHPEAVPDPAERWDRTNALLQTLVLRWSNRSSVSPTSSQIVLNDIDKSVVEMEKTFAFLHDLAEDAGVTTAEWQGRRLWLEKSLLRPLRTYRSEILPHHYKRQQTHSAESAS